MLETRRVHEARARWVSGLAVALWFVGSAGTSAAEEEIALLPLDVSGRLPADRTALETAAAKGLAFTNRPLLRSEEVLARLSGRKDELACSTPVCWMRLGARLGVGHLVQGTVEKNEGNYRSTFRLIETAGGRLLATESNDCEAVDCSVAELVRLSARELVRQTLGRKADRKVVAAVGASSPAAAAASVPATDSGGTPTPSPAQKALAALSLPGLGEAPRTGSTERLDDSAFARPPVWPVLAVIGGGAAIAAGAILMKVHGSCVEGTRGASRDCRTYDVRRGGIAWLVGGLALGTVGTVTLVKSADERLPTSGGQLGAVEIVFSGRF